MTEMAALEVVLLSAADKQTVTEFQHAVHEHSEQSIVSALGMIAESGTEL